MLNFFFNFYLAAPWLLLDHEQHIQGNSLTNPILITRFYLCQLEGHQESRSKIGFLDTAKCLVGFESRTF